MVESTTEEFIEGFKSDEVMKLINKDALVAEIEKLINEIYAGRSFDSLNSEQQTSLWYVKSIMSSINNLEVKEVDLEKIIDDYFKDWKFDDELDIMIKPNNYSASFTDLKEIAKHFFELGLKAQKGK